jgi:non-lysosomal glucosylceramidase
MPFSGKPTRLGKPRGYSLPFMLRMLPIYFRGRAIQKRAARGEGPPLGFNLRFPTDDGCNQGVPIGGLGAGSIGRGFLGDFARWHLRIVEHEYTPSLPNQFHLRIERGKDLFLQTLNPRKPTGERLGSWAWGMPATRGIYHALFPRAWTEYDFSDHGIRATCQQLSPVIAHNYRESSFPVGVFAWQIQNVSKKDAAVSLMLTWENAISPSQPAAESDACRAAKTGKRVVLELRQRHGDEISPASFGLAVQGDKRTAPSHKESFNTEGTGHDVWQEFQSSGQLSTPSSGATEGLHRSGAALCAQATIPARETAEVTFALSWDIPIMAFGSGRKWYRRYTRFFDTSGDNAASIAELALDHWREWERKITGWQQPVIDSAKPDWLKSALFNELYYLVDGQTAWENGEVGNAPAKEGIGHFGYQECFDYKFVNTYDVHFYASFALAMNWPEIEKSIQRDFAATVAMEDLRLVDLLFAKGRVHRKPRGAVPHDIGTPEDDPWIAPNAYSAQDVGRWKDLNSKFVLQVYHIFTLTKDDQFLRDSWPALLEAMTHLEQFDRDGDGLPENEGFPDQTYDVWTMKGVSAYCGSLFLAAAEAMTAMAERLNDEATATKYRGIVERGKVVFEEKLWNGEYYDFDSSSGRHSDSIMADQLAGHWYARACGLAPIVRPERARKALETIFKFNVLRFAQGTMGAVNGMRPNGKIDNSSTQGGEVWTGTTYALAALMIHEGLLGEALQTAEGVYQVTYKHRGYWFRTPEAWTRSGNFRACSYMRPLAIWAIEQALASTM